MVTGIFIAFAILHFNLILTIKRYNEFCIKENFDTSDCCPFFFCLLCPGRPKGLAPVEPQRQWELLWNQPDTGL